MQAHNQNNKKNYLATFARLAVHPQLCKHVLLALSSGLKKGAKRPHAEAFGTGADIAIEYLWPAAFSVLLIIDSINLAKQKFIYDSSPEEVWLSGLSQNQEAMHASLTSSFGVNRPDLAAFWAVSSFTLVLPIIAGFISMSISACKKKHISDINQPIGANLQQASIQSRGEEVRIQTYENLSEPLLPVAGDGLLLDAMPATKKSHTLGLLLLLAPARWYFMFTYFRVPILQIIRAKNYFQAKTECDDSGLTYTWSNADGDYACLPCDWSFVYPAGRRTVEGCMAGLLASPRNASTINSYLAQITGQLHNITELNLSTQNWHLWSGTGLSNFFDTTLKFAPNLQSLNLSSPDTTITLARPQLLAMQDYFTQSSSLAKLDLSGIQQRNETILAQALAHHSLETLKLERTDLTDLGLQRWLDTQDNTLQSLSVSFATLDGSLQWPKLSQLVTLQLMRSTINAPLFYNLTHWLGNSTLHTLNLYGTDLSDYPLKTLTENLNYIDSLSLSACNIGDSNFLQALPELTNTSLKKLDLSHNVFSYFGELIDLSFIKTLRSISLAGNDFIAGLTTIIKLIKTLPLTEIDLSTTTMLSQERENLIEALSNASMQTVAISSIELKNNELISMLNSWEEKGLSITSLDLSANQHLSNISLSLLMEAATALDIQSLSLAGTDLSLPIKQSAWQQLLSNNSSLTALNLKATQLSADNLEGLANTLGNDSSLKTLSLNENSISPESWNYFLEKMLTKPELMRGILPGNRGDDYNRYCHEHCLPNTKITDFDVSDSDLLGTNMQDFCSILNELPLKLTGVTFSQDQLVQLDTTNYPGCPAATETGTLPNYHRRLRATEGYAEQASALSLLGMLLAISGLALLGALLTLKRYNKQTHKVDSTRLPYACLLRKNTNTQNPDKDTPDENTETPYTPS